MNCDHALTYVNGDEPLTAKPPEPVDGEDMAEMITDECHAIREMLLEKNRRYGNSSADPVRIFADGSPLEQIAVRCDDKLKRIRTMGGLETVLLSGAEDAEDTVKDLIGYLVLARVVAGFAR